MALFDRFGSRPERGLFASADASTPALSVTAVETEFVTGVYAKLASVYDVFFGPWLHPGRVRAVERMMIKPGDRILEVGTGTGINIDLYPRECSVTGIDLSRSMLEKAYERVDRRGLHNVRLFEMDASHLQFADESFDIVYAPYLINVVPDPVQVAREMRRVCRSGGRIMFLNHFLSSNPIMSRIERLISPLTVYIGFKTDLELHGLFEQAGLEAASIERVNTPKALWSLVTCVKTETLT